LLAAYTLGGGLLRNFLEGMQRSTLPYGQGALALVAIVVAWLAWVLRFTVRACPACRPARFPWRRAADSDGAGVPILGRRSLLLHAGTGALAAALGGLMAVFANRDWARVFARVILAPAPTRADAPRPAWKESRVRSLRRLGRTELHVSDISFGCGQLREAGVARRAIERGVTYFDTSPDYSYHGSEEALGAAIQGHRDEVVIATKFCAANGHLPNDTPVDAVIRSVEGSLRRLRTDYVDLIHIHSCDRLDRLFAPNIHEAFDRLKEQGKARFLGVSSHAPNLEAVAGAAIDSGRFDVLMLAYHFGMWPRYDHILRRAQEADVGVVAMKTLKGAREARLARLPEELGSYPQAAFRWVLANPAVSCLVVSIVDERQIDEYLFASGEAPRSEDQALLERYDTLVAGDYCQPHCGRCRDVCPAGLPIDDILRARMYRLDYAWDSEAVRVVTRLQAAAEACVACPAPCARLCPQGIDIRRRVLETVRPRHSA